MDFVYNTNQDLEIIDPILAQYPAQDDPQYWEKVPALFEQVFNDEKRLHGFKDEAIIYRVPIFVQASEEMHRLSTAYLRDTWGMLSTNSDESKLTYLKMLEETNRGYRNGFNERTTYGFSIKVGDKDNSVITNYLQPIKLHNIVKYEKETGKKISDYDVIIEIGGGMGELARLIHLHGFKGEYWDVDFDPMTKIVKYYNEDIADIKTASDIDQLPDFTGKKVLLVGTHSFSETQIEYRERIIKKVGACDWLILFQCEFNGGIDNLNWFINTFPKLTKTNITMYCVPWHIYQGGNLYVFAEPK
jgi:hypothetical protein